MSEPFVLRWGDTERSINALKERLANPKPVLRVFSKKVIADVKENIERGGVNWPPPADSTVERWEREGATGKEVSSYEANLNKRAKALGSRIRKLQRLAGTKGWTPALRARAESLDRALKRLRKQEQRLTGGKVKRKKDATGAVIPEGPRKLLRRMPGTIRSKIATNGLRIYSAAGEIGAAHDYGAGKTPKREFLPPPNMDANMDYLAELLESDMGQAWETGNGR